MLTSQIDTKNTICFNFFPGSAVWVPWSDFVWRKWDVARVSQTSCSHQGEKEATLFTFILSRLLPVEVVTCRGCYLSRLLPVEVVTCRGCYLSRLLPVEVVTCRGCYLSRLLPFSCLDMIIWLVIQTVSLCPESFLILVILTFRHSQRERPSFKRLFDYLHVSFRT